jgi:hypothetical protein
MELLMRKTVFYILMALLLLSCTALAEKSGQLLEGSVFAEKTTGRFRYLPPEGMARRGEDEFILYRLQSRDKTETFSLSPAAWPGLSFRFAVLPGPGEGPGGSSESGGIPHRSPGGNSGRTAELVPVSCSFLCSSYSGWNEFTLDLSGTGRLTVRDRTYTLTLTRLEGLDISRGRIRRGDARISGSEALTALRNRRERIAALVEWMYLAGTPDFTGRKAFESYWKPVLFPERVFRKKRPPGYEKIEALWVRDGDLRWNAAYTAEVFPEELRPIRDSGAMFRDWEEAAAWIYLAYEWDAIVQSLGKELQFIED